MLPANLVDPVSFKWRDVHLSALAVSVVMLQL